jgi:hypothetical protein
MRASRLAPWGRLYWPVFVGICGLLAGCSALLDFDSKDSIAESEDWFTAECDLLLGVGTEDQEQAFDATQTVLLGALMQPQTGTMPWIWR